MSKAIKVAIKEGEGGMTNRREYLINRQAAKQRGRSGSVIERTMQTPRCKRRLNPYVHKEEAKEMMGSNKINLEGWSEHEVISGKMSRGESRKNLRNIKPVSRGPRGGVQKRQPSFKGISRYKRDSITSMEVLA